MKTKIPTSLLARSCFAFAVILSAWSILHAQSMAPMDMKMKMDGKMMAGCEEMMAKKQKMAADMKAQDAELTAHVAEMNRASGAEQTKIMAAVVTHMVELRISTDAQKAKLEEAMTAHMMEHMMAGAASMAGCPMMKSMGAMGDTMKDAHAQHGENSK